MKIKKARFHTSRKLKFLLAAGLIVAGTSGVAAFNALQKTSADEMSPTQVMVQDHEARIQKNENDIASTEDQVKQVGQKADDASQNAAAAQQRVTVVERKVETQPAVAAQTPAANVAPTAAPTRTPSVTVQANSGPDADGRCYVNYDRQYEIDCVTHELVK